MATVFFPFSFGGIGIGNPIAIPAPAPAAPPTPVFQSDNAVGVVEELTDFVFNIDTDLEGRGTYSIVDGVDARFFEIDADSGNLSFQSQVPDFESPRDANRNNIYDVTVQFTSNQNQSVTQAIQVTILDRNEAPVLLNGGTDPLELNLFENTRFVTDLIAEDVNDAEGNGLSYQITGGTDQARFEIDENTGEVSFRDAPDFAQPQDANQDNTYDLEVSVIDSGLNFADFLGREDFVEFRGKIYVQSSVARSWSDSQAEAEALSGNLLVIDSEDELRFIEEVFSADSLWTGLQDIDGTERLSYVNGEEINVFRSANTPSIDFDAPVQALDSVQEGASAVALTRDGDRYNFLDANATGTNFSIIEIDPEDLRRTTTQLLAINLQASETQAVDDQFTIEPGVSIPLNVLGNDIEGRGEVLEVNRIGQAPVNGTAEINPDGTIQYQPNPGFAGANDIFTYFVSEGTQSDQEATVRIAVNGDQALALTPQLRAAAITQASPTTQATPLELSISGQVFNDTDQDRAFSADDTGMAGIEIQLFRDFDQNNREDGEAIQTVITDESGSYTFSGLETGTYIVREVDAENTVSIRDRNGANPNRITAINLSNEDSNISNIDFLNQTATNNPEGILEQIGTAGNDRLSGTNQSERLNGLQGNDVLLGQAGGDTLLGEAGSDVLKGMGGNDRLSGGAGSDRLYGGGGKDILVGQQLSSQGASEQDLLKGGAGADRFVLGTNTASFYTLGQEEDFATIVDFDHNDTLQLFGHPEDYQVESLDGNIRLSYLGNNDPTPDLIAVFNDLDNLNLNSQQVVFVND